MSTTSKHDAHWKYSKLEFSNEEKKILFAKALEVGTFMLFSQHIFQFGSRIFKQKKVVRLESELLWQPPEL